MEIHSACFKPKQEKKKKSTLKKFIIIYLKKKRKKNLIFQKLLYFLIVCEIEFSALILNNFLCFFIFYLGSKNPGKIYYLSGNETFSYFRKWKP